MTPQARRGVRWAVALGGTALILGVVVVRMQDRPAGAVLPPTGPDHPQAREPAEIAPQVTAATRTPGSPPPSLSDLRARLDQDVVLSPEPTGGIRITFVREGSVAAARGFRANDLLKQVDASEIRGVDQARDAIVEALAMSRAHEFQIERTGRTLLLRFRAKKE